ncbi:Transposase [Vibrio tubiashii]|uniref:Uncharacterized protein n=1 Tax=Vibrio tubiashii ATCC 19109 TaxID=1051646 RepID=F9T6R4_9VIBR|nr:hypothetical protein IX91_26130 [Vibrio tubiashii ATCC 19109]EGU54469.1 hypothetical protein VITU9109_02807 [Vibrio tubiashii ATCC 19109]EIF04224.1 hypothetical protein VT1337_09547 [Vibrio tubiashii NCIMB 1337 = ATCC 19106]
MRKDIRSLKALIVRKSSFCGYSLHHENPSYQNLTRLEAIKAEAAQLEITNQMSGLQKMAINHWVNSLENRYQGAFDDEC